MNRFQFLLLAFGGLSAVADAIPAGPTEQQVQLQVLGRYFAAVSAQAGHTRGVGMDMDFSARLPKLKKEGTMLARRIVSSLGKISFVVKSFTGDNTVKNNVIAKYMAGEVSTAEKEIDAGINLRNYKFKFKRTEQIDGRTIFVYELNPRKKRVGLFKGELWIDETTALPVREAGRLVKSPSMFLKRVEFTRTYEVHNGTAFPARIESTVETRIAGKAELNIRYTNFVPEVPIEAVTP